MVPFVQWRKRMAEKTGSEKPILVPVDFSTHSEAALLQACELSERLKIPLLVLHVVHDPAEMPGYYSQVTKKPQMVRLEDAAAEMLDDFLKGITEKCPNCKSLRNLESMLVVGLPVTRILEVAETVEAVMIVMGSKGRTGLDHMMLGSKAEQVVRLSPIPVLIVKAAKELHHE
jgi:nucleotide-binding universal stress UspA family protein